MIKLTYESWLETTVNLFEETAEGVSALEWLETSDFVEAFDSGLTPTQVYDKFVYGYWF